MVQDIYIYQGVFFQVKKILPDLLGNEVVSYARCKWTYYCPESHHVVGPIGSVSIPIKGRHKSTSQLSSKYPTHRIIKGYNTIYYTEFSKFNKSFREATQDKLVSFVKNISNYTNSKVHQFLSARFYRQTCELCGELQEHESHNYK